MISLGTSSDGREAAPSLSSPARRPIADRVAVTGGAGFIGSHTVDLLVEHGVTVMVIDDLSHCCGVGLPGSVELVEADCGSPLVAKALRRFRPEALLHLAAKGGVERALRDPGAHVRAGLASTVALFHAAAEAGVRRLSTASSGGAVYGDAAKLPAGEAAPAAPRSPYGAGKAAEEVYLGCFQRLVGLESAVALRYANVYGPRQDGTGEAGVVAISCWRLNAGDPPIIFGDGEQTRDFVFVDDVARANVLSLQADRIGPVNIGTGYETTINRVVEILEDRHGKELRAEHRPARGGEIRKSRLSPSRAREWWGWEPSITLEEGLSRTFQFFAGVAGPMPATGDR